MAALQAATMCLQRHQLPEHARRVDQARATFEQAVDLDKKVNVPVGLEDRFDLVGEVQKERRAEIAHAIEETRRALSVIAADGQDMVRQTEIQEAQERRAAEAAAQATLAAQAAERAREAEAFARFSVVAKANLDRGCAAAVSGIYMLGKDGVGQTLALSVTLVPPGHDIGEPVGPRLFDQCGVRAFRGKLPPERVSDLLAAVCARRVPATCLPDGVGDDLDLGLHGGWLPRTDDYEVGSARVPAIYQAFAGHSFVVSGGRVLDLVRLDVWDQVKARLPAGDPPFVDPGHLSRALDVVPPVDPGSAYVQCSVYSPTWLRLGEVVVDEATRQVAVEVVSTWPVPDPTATITLIPLADGMRGPPPISLTAAGWTATPASGGEPVLYRRTFPIPGGVDRVLVSLNAGGRRIDGEEIGNPPVRLVSHALLDPDFKVLLTHLKSDKSELFEKAVCLLLHLCGLSVGAADLKGIQRAPDIIAFHGDGVALFGECTVEPPDQSKTRNLGSRAEALRTTLRTYHGREIALVRTMFVSRPRGAMVSEAVDGALGERVILAFHEDLADLLAMARRGDRPERILGHLATLGGNGMAVPL